LVYYISIKYALMHGYGTHKVTIFTASQINTELNCMDKDIVVEH